MVSHSPVPRRRETNWFAWVASFIVFGTFGLGALLLIALFSGGSESPIALVELSGPISDTSASGLLGGGASGARSFINEVERARRDDSVKAVVIRINSPGGSPAASQEMYQALRRLHDAKKPVICSMGDVAASGGYYVAAACDKIYANASSTTGSIGVIAELPNARGLMNKLGVDVTTIKSGKFKDIGNPTRAVTPDERQFLQRLNADIYQQFVADVVAGRNAPTSGKLTRAKLLAIADGRVFTGRQAKAALLVDENGGLYDAIQDAAKRAGVKSDNPAVRKLSSGGGLGGLFGASASSGALDEVVQGFGAAFARGAWGQMKADASQVPMPQAR